MPTFEDLTIRARKFIEKIGVGELSALHNDISGGNNQVCRAVVGKSNFLLKHYFWHPDDQRDRMQAELAFMHLAWRNGISAIPKIIGYDYEQRFGLFEYIEGRKLRSDEISTRHIKSILSFFVTLNQYRRTTAAQVLAQASEACFSIRDHLTCVEGRLSRLLEVDSSDTITEKAIIFSTESMSDTWLNIRETAIHKALSLGIDIDRKLSQPDICLSPSDFGFHNAILTPKAELKFFDFEYAGWDDPAKMVCDFFCQPAIPVPEKYFQMVMAKLKTVFSEPDPIMARIELLMPVYRMKWCCILLNEFLPVGFKRRFFAQNTRPLNHRRLQLEKAKAYFNDFFYGMAERNA